MNTRMCLKNTLDNNYLIHSRGANTQKIKRIDHCNCNVGASKNAEQAYFLSSSSLLTSPP